MIDESADQGFSTTARLRAAVATAVRAPWSRIPLGLGWVLIGASGLFGSYAVAAAGPDACMELQQAEFTTIEELIATKDKVLAYQRDPEGELVLSGKEASFLLADHLKYPVWIETRADELYIQFALPDDERCYNIEYLGRVSVESGLAHVVPSSVQVGALDLSPLASGRAIDVIPDDLTGPEARQLLTQTRMLRVEGDRIHVMLDDPGSLR